MEKVKPKALDVLLQQFLFVHTCWQDPVRSVRHKMSYDRAIKELVEVREQALRFKFGSRLAHRAQQLLNEIVKAPMPIDATEATGS